MPTLRIKNAHIILEDRVLKNSSILLDGGKIVSVGSKPVDKNIPSIDAQGCFLSPGFIDSHIHGRPAEVLKNEMKYGTTSIVAAISCASPRELYKKIKCVRSFKEKGALGQSVIGVRIEGPYISRIKAGAQNKKHIKKASVRGLKRIIKEADPVLKMVTIAPELKGARELIRLLRKSNIIASIGHSNADYAQAAKGVRAGITHATHIFNAMSGIGSHDTGASGASLVDKCVAVEVIMDLIHVDQPLFELVLEMKNKRSVIIITDSVKAEGNSRMSGGVYRLKDGTVAGSCLTMIKALKNAVTICGVRLTDAVRFMTINPARVFGVEKRTGSIQAGRDADIVIFDKDFNVKMTIVRGKIVFRKKGF